MPKRFLQFLGLLVLTVLLSVFIFRIMDFPLVGTSPTAEVVEEIELKFVERNRFDVVVLDKYGRFLAESTDGSNGFLGVVYNAVKRERIKRRVVAENFLRLVQYKNGRISVIDDTTGLEIQVNSFGVKNLEVFGLLFNK
jgi:putative photosynthetic complex assembly protein